MTIDGGVRRVVRTMARMPRALWAGFVVAIVLTAGVAVAEVISRASTEEVSDLAAGSQIDTGPFLLTVERARVLDELPGVSESDDSTRVIALVVTASANSTKTLSGAMLADSVALQGVDGLAPDDAPATAANVFVMADGSRLDVLQPGLEYEVAMVWEQRSQRPAPTELEVVVAGRTLRESVLDRSVEWLDRAPVAVGEVPITPPDEATDGAGG